MTKPHKQDTYALPSLTAQADTLTRHFLMQFMHEFQKQREANTGLRIYKAIESTAGKTGNSPEVVARALVETGLRAERHSFPEKFITLVESNALTPRWNIGAITPHQRELLDFWGVKAVANGYKRARRYH